MRMLFTVVADTEAATRAIENGTAQQSIKEALERLKPEAAYFYLQNGKRTSLFVLDVADPSEIIPLAEPLFCDGPPPPVPLPCMSPRLAAVPACTTHRDAKRAMCSSRR